MVTLLKVTRNASIYRQAVCCTRGLKTFYPLCAASHALDTAQVPPKKRTVTRKKYSELPTARIQADGGLAPPLEEWHGGLEDPKAVYSRDTPFIPRHIMKASASSDHMLANNIVTKSTECSHEVQPSESTSLEADEAKGNAATEVASKPVVKPRRGRKKAILIAEASTVTCSEPGNPAKTKRTRKRKTAIVEEATAGTYPERPLRQPKNALAVEILHNLAKFPHCILLTRVGQFYESYFDQAKEVARLLDIKLTQRTWDGQRIWMCGFPLMHLDKHLKTLVQGHNRFVAMCEEFPRVQHLGPKGGFNRRVVRIVTPGTLIDEPFLNPYENNYLLSIAGSSSADSTEIKHNPVGLAWIDVSTGEFFTKSSTFEGLRDELVRIGPREVVLDQSEPLDDSHPIRLAITEEGLFTSSITPSDFASHDVLTYLTGDSSGADDVTSHLELHKAEAVSILTDPEVCAINLLTTFLQANLLEHMPALSSPSRETTDGRMQIDSNTIRALEIRERLSDGGSAGSLFSVVKRTVTTSGTRLLGRWLCSPSTSIREINARQSLVAFFHARPYLREDLVQALGDLEDATRIVQRFLLGRGQPSDLSAICSTIRTWVSIKRRIELEKSMERQERGFVQDEEWSSVDALMHGMHDLRRLADMIENAVTALVRPDTSAVEEATEEEDANRGPSLSMQYPNMRTNYGTLDGSSDTWTIKPEFSPQLTVLHARLKELFNRREQLERRLQLAFGIADITLRGLDIDTLFHRCAVAHLTLITRPGMHVHIARGKRDATRLKDSPEFISISESNSTHSFFHRDWSQLGAQIVETVTAIYAAEKEAFEMLRDDVSTHSAHLRYNARILDELDVTVAFANLANDMSLVKPTLTEDTSYHVVNGRHPSVELGLLTAGRVFTPNTVTFTPESRLHIITGPNMAGKSTLLRQTALIAILAQTGSFVPADAATIGVVDRVFSRVGAKDDLFRDRSTFMVEMMETSEILRRATPNSLVIMDEVGRGTTVDDGLAIAFAAVHYLLSVNGCRAMFATHFHELSDLLGCSSENTGQGPFSDVSFFCTDVDETEDGYFSYSHRLRPGVNRDSHGLKVAQLAGLPNQAIEVARAAMSWLRVNRRRTTHADELQSLGQALASR